MEASKENDSEGTIHFFEEDRLKTFKNWPFDDTKPCNVRKMAEAGFYWCGDDRDNDTSACFICGKVLDGWEENDDPWSEHRKHAPQCAFLKYGKAQQELTVEEIYSLVEVICKQNVQKKMTKLKDQMKQVTETAQYKIKQLYAE